MSRRLLGPVLGIQLGLERLATAARWLPPNIYNNGPTIRATATEDVEPSGPGPGGPGSPAGPGGSGPGGAGDPVVLATPVGLVGQAVLAVPAATNLAAPEVTAVMGPADQADLASPVVRGRVTLADMILGAPEDPEDLGIRDRAERFMTALDP